MLLPESSCVCMPSFRPVAPFFFPGNTIFGFFFFNTERGCGHIGMLMMFP